VISTYQANFRTTFYPYRRAGYRYSYSNKPATPVYSCIISGLNRDGTEHPGILHNEAKKPRLEHGQLAENKELGHRSPQSCSFVKNRNHSCFTGSELKTNASPVYTGAGREPGCSCRGNKEGVASAGKQGRTPATVKLVGLGSYSGTVAAAPRWGATMRVMNLPAAKKGSWEHLLHQAGGNRLLMMDDFRGNDPLMKHYLGHRVAWSIMPQPNSMATMFPRFCPCVTMPLSSWTRPGPCIRCTWRRLVTRYRRPFRSADKPIKSNLWRRKKHWSNMLRTRNSPGTRNCQRIISRKTLRNRQRTLMRFHRRRKTLMSPPRTTPRLPAKARKSGLV